jgi:hypothetical protein
MKKLFIVCLLAMASMAAGAQSFAVKTNLLYLGTGTPNLGVEFGMGKRVTMSLTGGYNALNIEETTTTKPSLAHYLGTAELRYWFCKRFDGTFLGLQGLYGDYVIEDVPLVDLPKKYRFDGTAYGGSLVVGNQWALGKRWGMELSVGVGVLLLEYDKSVQNSGPSKGKFKQTYVGPTKLNFSFMYFFK